MRYTHLLKKLGSCDVDDLERIFLPKKESATYLPEIEARNGISITMENIRTSHVLNIRYRTNSLHQKDEDNERKFAKLTRYGDRLVTPLKCSPPSCSIKDKKSIHSREVLETGSGLHMRPIRGMIAYIIQF
ncbi:hypothetical protein MKW98_011385 [Papaver atlanticum]|uniref:Uncharacterized protein n=1 Tax=Papaver atlanticum TaxID=357466 RepID=A0AAD4XJD9_9MAGN|nr:hypothetical protein MKW98_011385 [Papaver atlanticum]